MKTTYEFQGVKYLLGSAGSLILACPKCGEEHFREPENYFWSLVPKNKAWLDKGQKNYWGEPSWHKCMTCKTQMEPIMTDELESRWKPFWRSLGHKVTESSNAVLGGISQETPMELCYSINEEDFNLTSVEDVLDTLDDEGRLEEGAVYWEADCRRMQASDVFSVEQVLKNMCERLYEEVGEIADDYPAVPPEAKTELKYFLTAWVEKHAPPNQYWMVVGKPREKRVTADDLPPNA